MDKADEGWQFSTGFINEDMVREHLFPGEARRDPGAQCLPCWDPVLSACLAGTLGFSASLAGTLGLGASFGSGALCCPGEVGLCEGRAVAPRDLASSSPVTC